MIKRTFLICALLSSSLFGAEISWRTDLVEDDDAITNVGGVVEAFAFTGDRANNALPEAIEPLEDEFDVNGVTFSVLNFTLGDFPDQLEGLTYDNGEFGHTAADEGYQALLDGLAFQSGTGEQFMELTGLEQNQQVAIRVRSIFLKEH